MCGDVRQMTYRCSWSEVDFWRSYVAALAMEHGDDPDDAAEKHRQWCIDMGIEPMEDEDE